VVAVPNRDYPPPRDILASAQLVLDSLPELSVDLVGQLGDGEPASLGRRAIDSSGLSTWAL